MELWVRDISKVRAYFIYSFVLLTRLTVKKKKKKIQVASCLYLSTRYVMLCKWLKYAVDNFVDVCMLIAFINF